MGITRTFIDANVSLSRATMTALDLPNDKTLWSTFEHDVHDQILGLPDGARVIDVGGGRRCVYHHALRPEITLVATDVSVDELVLNPHADETVVADLSEGLPLEADSADLVVSRAVLEHVADVRAAARHMYHVTKPGGRTMNLMPARFSLFGVAARLLPFRPLIELLHRVAPETVDQVEFDVYYDQGTPDRMERAFRDAGFDDVSVQVTWAQPDYFTHFYPVFLLYAGYEALVRRLGIRRLASYMVVRARKPSAASPS
jgi:ubiquinone/menaquinone biosynthesis C-methylase UbiE